MENIEVRGQKRPKRPPLKRNKTIKRRSKMFEIIEVCTRNLLDNYPLFCEWTLSLLVYYCIRPYFSTNPTFKTPLKNPTSYLV